MPIEKNYEKILRRAVEKGPYYQLLGITLEEIDIGLTRFRMPYKKELTQIFGEVHGGAIASLADTSVAFALMTLIQPGERVATVEFKINFFKRVNGGEIFGEAKIVKKGKQLATADIEIKNEKGDLIAKGMATYVISGFPKPGDKRFADVLPL